MPETPRIAIFQAHWRLHSSVVFSAQILSARGYDVKIFLYRIDESLPIAAMEGLTNVSVYSFEPRTSTLSTQVKRDILFQKSILCIQKKIINALIPIQRLARYLKQISLLYTAPEVGLIPSTIRKQTLSILGQDHYAMLIGVEKGGLAWAGSIAKEHDVPLIYSSLELYTRDHWFCQSIWNKRLKATEEKYHRLSVATIVQDKARGDILYRDNQVKANVKAIYFPVSRMGDARYQASDWLQTHLGIVNGELIILAHGMISIGRLSLAIAEEAQSFEPNWKLVLHGWGSETVIDSIRLLDSKQQVRLSLELVDISKEQEIVSSAHIGLVLYGNECINDRLTGFSSEKLSLYLQCGVPVIAFDYPTYEHIRTEGCGVLVKSISEIKGAIETIVSDYDSYRANAFSVFNKYYRFETNFEKVLEVIDRLQ